MVLWVGLGDGNLWGLGWEFDDGQDLRALGGLKGCWLIGDLTRGKPMGLGWV